MHVFTVCIRDTSSHDGTQGCPHLSGHRSAYSSFLQGHADWLSACLAPRTYAPLHMTAMLVCNAPLSMPCLNPSYHHAPCSHAATSAPLTDAPGPATLSAHEALHRALHPAARQAARACELTSAAGQHDAAAAASRSRAAGGGGGWWYTCMHVQGDKHATRHECVNAQRMCGMHFTMPNARRPLSGVGIIPI